MQEKDPLIDASFLPTLVDFPVYMADYGTTDILTLDHDDLHDSTDDDDDFSDDNLVEMDDNIMSADVKKDLLEVYGLYDYDDIIAPPDRVNTPSGGNYDAKDRNVDDIIEKYLGPVGYILPTKPSCKCCRSVNEYNRSHRKRAATPDYAPILRLPGISSSVHSTRAPPQRSVSFNETVHVTTYTPEPPMQELFTETQVLPSHEVVDDSRRIMQPGSKFMPNYYDSAELDTPREPTPDLKPLLRESPDLKPVLHIRRSPARDSIPTTKPALKKTLTPASPPRTSHSSPSFVLPQIQMSSASPVSGPGAESDIVMASYRYNKAMEKLTQKLNSAFA